MPKPLMLITGASRRIGAGLAESFASTWRLALHCTRKNAAIEQLADKIKRHGGHVSLFAYDFRVDGQADRLITQVITSMGVPTCLINNASVFLKDHLAKDSADHWQDNMTVNAYAPLQIIRAFKRHVPNNHKACIINMTDQRVLNLTPFFTSYTLSKVSLSALTRLASLALAPHIRVNAIAPGPILANDNQSQEEFDQQCQRMPLRQGGSIHDISLAIEFFLQAKSVTGQTIAIDGGQHLGWMHAQTQSEE